MILISGSALFQEQTIKLSHPGSVCTAGARKKGARLKPASSYLFLKTVPQLPPSQFFGRMQIIVLSTIDQKENQKLE